MPVLTQLAISFALLAGAAPAQVTRSLELPSWLSVSMRPTEPSAVAEMFRSLLRDEIARKGGRYFGSMDAGWNRERYLDIREPEGKLSTRWHFTRPAAANAEPASAVRFRVADHSPYSVGATIFCAPSTCADLLQRLARLPPLEPGLEADNAVRGEWLRAILGEQCRHATSSTPPPRYPREELRREIGGRVELRLVVNPCGEVRAASTRKSSGNLGLDRAARRQALAWRLPAGSEPVHNWSTWVQFGPLEENTPRSEPVTVGEFEPIPSP